MNSLILEVLKIVFKDIKEIIKAKNKKEIKAKILEKGFKTRKKLLGSDRKHHRENSLGK